MQRSHVTFRAVRAKYLDNDRLLATSSLAMVSPCDHCLDGSNLKLKFEARSTTQGQDLSKTDSSNLEPSSRYWLSESVVTKLDLARKAQRRCVNVDVEQALHHTWILPPFPPSPCLLPQPVRRNDRCHEIYCNINNITAGDIIIIQQRGGSSIYCRVTKKGLCSDDNFNSIISAWRSTLLLFLLLIVLH